VLECSDRSAGFGALLHLRIDSWGEFFNCCISYRQGKIPGVGRRGVAGTSHKIQ